MSIRHSKLRLKLCIRRSYTLLERRSVMRYPCKCIVMCLFSLLFVFELFTWYTRLKCVSQACRESSRNLLSEPDTVSSLTGWDRAALVRDRCREMYGETFDLQNKYYPFENRVFLASKEKLAYCAIAKAFSSNMKRIFLYLSDSKHSAEKLASNTKPLENIEYPHQQSFWKDKSVLKHHSEAERENILKTYFKFVFVRDPVFKVMSAYRDKFYGNSNDVFHSYFRSTIAKSICRDIEEYQKRHDAPKPLKDGIVQCTTNPVFIDLKAFLSWTLLVPSENKSPSHGHNDYNPHWAPSVPLCRICEPSMNYDFVGHFERGKEDINAILNFSGWNFPFPNVNDTQYDTVLSDEEKAAFKKDIELLPPQFIEELSSAAATERYILGYSNIRPE